MDDFITDDLAALGVDDLLDELEVPVVDEILSDEG